MLRQQREGRSLAAWKEQPHHSSRNPRSLPCEKPTPPPTMEPRNWKTDCYVSSLISLCPPQPAGSVQLKSREHSTGGAHPQGDGCSFRAWGAATSCTPLLAPRRAFWSHLLSTSVLCDLGLRDGQTFGSQPGAECSCVLDRDLLVL